MIKVSTKEYEKLLEINYDARQPLFVMGGFGIGKSAIPRQLFSKIAKKQGLQYIEWSDAVLSQKMECINNPEKYFVFADQRTSQMDTTSLVGIPNMTKSDLLENIPYSWVVYFTQLKANGVIFFDEINLAAPIVQSITYSAIHDRVISDRRLGPNVYVFAAGNRMKDQAHIFNMPAPLKDRFSELEVEHNTDEWVDWAIENRVNPHLISFIQWKPSNLYNASIAKDEKPSTPRGVVRASKLMGSREITSNQVHQLISIAAGESFATEFQAYVKCYRTIEWKVLFANPKSAKELTLDQQFAVSGGLVSQFTEAVEGKSKKDAELIDNIFSVTENLRDDFTINVLRMLRDTNREQFVKALKSHSKGPEWAKKYTKFLVNLD